MVSQKKSKFQAPIRHTAWRTKQIPIKKTFLLSILLITIYCLLPASLLFSQDGGVPGALLDYGMSPRTIAMGKAFTGLADDQEAVYYNPGGLAQVSAHCIKASGMDLYGNQLGYLGYAMPTRRYGTLGIGLIGLYTKDIDARDEFMQPYEAYKFMQNCLLFSYAYQPATLFSLGLNLKFLQSKIAQYSALGVGGDAGLFILPHNDLTFGVACQNLLGPKLSYNIEGGSTDEIPVNFRFGGALKLYQGRAIIAADLEKNILDYTSWKYHLGLEFMLVKPYLTLRGGLDKNSIGVGVGLKKEWGRMAWGIDYAVELPLLSYILPYRHKVGIVIDFGGFRTWVSATPKRFSPSPGRKENVAWLDLHYSAKKEIKRWQLLIKNQYGELVRTYSGWDAPPLRLSWDGLDDVGRLVADGRYYYEIIIVDVGGERLSFSDFLVSIVTLGPEGEIEFIPQE
jgi:hypothetical protein